MKQFAFLKEVLTDSLVTIVLGGVAFSLVLIVTLDFVSAMLIFTIFLFLAVLQQSFSRGWLFLFAFLLLLPSIKVGSGYFTIFELFATILALVGLVSMALENRRIPLNRLSYILFTLVLIGTAIITFGNFFDQVVDPNVWFLTITFVLIWALITTFQYFFQTQKRIDRFFKILIFVGLMHALFGVTAFLFDWQTSSGLGISSAREENLLVENINFQVNGFLGDGLLLRVGENALAPLLLLTIMITTGMILSKSFKLATKKITKEGEARNENRFFDSVYFHKTGKVIRNSIVDLKNLTDKSQKNWFEKRSFLVLVLMIQVIALVLTFSYSSLIFLAIGLFIAGVLLREKTLLSLTASAIIILVIAFPGFRSSLISESENNFSQWFVGFEEIKQSPISGSGWRIQREEGVVVSASANNIYNSYLFVWNTFGIIGLIFFLIALIYYFIEIRSAYIQSEGVQRIWLIIVLAIFIEFVLLGLTNNTLLFGPAALSFWILYGVTLNLKKKQIQFGLTETKL